MRPTNKVSFISGGGTGKGKCTAELFSKEGSADIAMRHLRTASILLLKTFCYTI